MQTLPKTLLQQLQQIVASGHLLTEPADCWLYSYDNHRYHALPSAVVFAREHKEVQKIVKACHDHYVPVIVRGRGTGTPFGNIPVQGGVVLTLEKMDRLIQFDPANQCITVQAGMLNQTVQDTLAPHGFFWAPYPNNAAFCSVGGNLGLNAAGARAVKYGTTREHTLGLRAVLGNGDTIHTGISTTNHNVGYDFTRLLIGSEGSLAIITEATLRLTFFPEAKTTLQLIYNDIVSAASALTKIMSQRVIPFSLEFLDHTALLLLQQHGVTIPENAKALLLIEVEGSNTEVKIKAEKIVLAATNEGLINITMAENDEHAKKIGATRKALTPALRTLASKRTAEDVVIPISQLLTFVEVLQEFEAHYQFPILCFGHIGCGNVYVNVLVDPQNSGEEANADLCLNDIFDSVIKLNGTLSGEQGLGIVKRTYIERIIDPVALNLMRLVKQQFDPRGILNPGKIFS